MSMKKWPRAALLVAVVLCAGASATWLSQSHKSEEEAARIAELLELRPGEVLRAVVFLRRLGDLEGNGRPRSRRFLGFLRGQLPTEATAPSTPRLIIPGA